MKCHFSWNSIMWVLVSTPSQWCHNWVSCKKSKKCCQTQTKIHDGSCPTKFHPQQNTFLTFGMCHIFSSLITFQKQLCHLKKLHYTLNPTNLKPQTINIYVDEESNITFIKQFYKVNVVLLKGLCKNLVFNTSFFKM